MLRPYTRALRRYAEITPKQLDTFDALDPDERLPIMTVLDLLKGAVEVTGDSDLGLKAAREILAGDCGVVEFVVNSAATVRDAIELLERYLPLLNDAMLFSFRVEGGHAIIQLDSRVPLPRAAADFQSAAFYLATSQRGIVDPQCEACFAHACPALLDEYLRTFAPGRVRFDADFNGFVFDAKLLDRPLPSSDPGLHTVLRRYADLMLADLHRSETLADRVQRFLSQELRRGEPTVERTAAAFHISRRTLARKLEREGTSFRTLLDETRRRLALRYILERDVGVAEIAFLLGFTHAGAFYRAFKRWTGRTPTEYRVGQRAAAPAAG